jgi:hypothetical protein
MLRVLTISVPNSINAAMINKKYGEYYENMEKSNHQALILLTGVELLHTPKKLFISEHKIIFLNNRMAI